MGWMRRGVGAGGSGSDIAKEGEKATVECISHIHALGNVTYTF